MQWLTIERCCINAVRTPDQNSLTFTILLNLIEILSHLAMLTFKKLYMHHSLPQTASRLFLLWIVVVRIIILI